MAKKKSIKFSSPESAQRFAQKVGGEVINKGNGFKVKFEPTPLKPDHRVQGHKIKPLMFKDDDGWGPYSQANEII